MINPLNLYKYLPLLLRKRFKQKYIIIESDDWGLQGSIDDTGIRFLRKNYQKESFTRWTTDSLETVEDLELLFDVLNKYKYEFECPPKITANFITHNIDYDKKTELSFTPLNQLLIKNKILKKKYFEGINGGIIYPQLHGYCHYNIDTLRDFYLTDEGRKLFDQGFLTGQNTLKGSSPKFRSEFSKFNFDVKEKLKISIDEFNNVFNFSPESIIPPHFIIEAPCLDLLTGYGIKAIQASNRLINFKGDRYRKIFFRKQNNIHWMPRNVRLDPHPDYNYYSKDCISQIDKAFSLKMPAIIDFHRVNISGRFNSNYRDKSLNELDIVFKIVKAKWPDAKFISTSDFIQLCLI